MNSPKQKIGNSFPHILEFHQHSASVPMADNVNFTGSIYHKKLLDL